MVTEAVATGIGNAVSYFLGALIFYGLWGLLGNKNQLPEQAAKKIRLIFLVVFGSGLVIHITNEQKIADSMSPAFALLTIIVSLALLIYAVYLSYDLKSFKCDSRRRNVMIFLNTIRLIFYIVMVILGIVSVVHPESLIQPPQQPEFQTTIITAPKEFKPIPYASPYPSKPVTTPEASPAPEPEAEVYETLEDVPGIKKRETGIVTQVIDGETYRVKTDVGKIISTRLIGIDFPDVDLEQLKYWTDRGWSQTQVKLCYKEGNEVISSALLSKQVILWSDDKEDEQDKNGRLLRYVTLADDPYPINLILVQTGWAVMHDLGQRDCTLCGALLNVEQEAEQNKEGCLWSS